jgi:LDH2 family malate/lactate/ureidoglycolate dehydrogenase
VTAAQTDRKRSSPRFEEGPLRAFVERVLELEGTPATTAAIVADTLVEADRRGVHTHGVVRLPSYRAQIRAGEVMAAAEPAIEREDGPTAWVDGRRAFGALTAKFCTDEAIARCHSHGVAVVSARHCMHFGAAAYWALKSASRGLIGIAATNTPGVLAPFGGIEARLGNNPLAIAAPMPAGRPPFVLDMAQSAVARGRVKLAEMNEETIPEGWGIDPEGRATTDPTKALAGALLPFGGYKGYGLAVAVEILAGVLAGAGLSPELVNTSMTGAPESRREVVRGPGSVGNIYITIDPDRFAGRERFLERVGWFTDNLKATPVAPSFDEVLLPGELEARSADAAHAQGIEVESTTVSSLRALADELSVPFPSER